MRKHLHDKAAMLCIQVPPFLQAPR